jgi:phage terminase large subunit GpA-like protein
MTSKIHADLISSFKESFEPIFTGSVSDWASLYVDLPPNYAVQGSFDVSISKYLCAPMNELRDTNVTQINLIGATQTGKTLVSELFIPYVVVNDPGPVLRLHQTDEMAQLFTETRLLPLLNKCKPVKTMLEGDRFSAKKTGVNLPHMSIKIAGAKENVLHGQSIRYLLLDECWLYLPEVVQKAKARTTAFGSNKKIIVTSQPGIEGDQLDEENRGKCYEWGWKCPEA